jgi:cysteine desulfurase
MVEALSICVREIDSRRQRVEQLRTRLVEQLHASGIEFAINTPLEASSAYVLNLSFPDCRGELLLMKLDLLGVAASTGSACSSGSLLASPVLTAMRLEESRIESAMRFSFDPELTEEEIDLAAKRIVEAVQRVRS